MKSIKAWAKLFLLIVAVFLGICGILFLSAWIYSQIFGLLFPGSGLDKLTLLEVAGFLLTVAAVMLSNSLIAYSIKQIRQKS